MDWGNIKAKDKSLKDSAKATDALTPPEIPLDQIYAVEQVRKSFSNLSELANDIKVRGVLQPITVVVGDKQNTYKLHVGERRFRAAKLAGLKTIPAFVRPSTDEFNRIANQLAENIQREKLPPLDIATSLYEMKVINGITNREVAEAVGKDLKYVGSHLALLRGPESVQSLLAEGLLNDVDAADNLIKIFGYSETEGDLLVARYEREDPPSRAEVRNALKKLKTISDKQSSGGEDESKEAKGLAHRKAISRFVATEADARAWKPRPPEEAHIRVKLSVKGVAIEGRLLIDRADDDDGKVWVLGDDDTEFRVPLKSLTILSVK